MDPHQRVQARASIRTFTDPNPIPYEPEPELARTTDPYPYTEPALDSYFPRANLPHYEHEPAQELIPNHGPGTVPNSHPNYGAPPSGRPGQPTATPQHHPTEPSRLPIAQV